MLSRRVSITKLGSSYVPPLASCSWCSPPSWAPASACAGAVRTVEARCTRDRGRTQTVTEASTLPHSSLPPSSSCELYLFNLYWSVPQVTFTFSTITVYLNRSLPNSYLRSSRGYTAANFCTVSDSVPVSVEETGAGSEKYDPKSAGQLGVSDPTVRGPSVSANTFHSVIVYCTNDIQSFLSIFFYFSIIVYVLFFLTYIQLNYIWFARQPSAG